MASERSERGDFILCRAYAWGFVLGDYLLSLFERVAERVACTIIVQGAG